MIPYGSTGVPAPVERLDFTERVLAESRGTRELKPGR
jgi:hypothetical protein